MRIRLTPGSCSALALLAMFTLPLTFGACAAESGSASAGLSDLAHAKCTQPGIKGNSFKVGMYCTKGGGECDYNDPSKGEAYLCTLDQEPTAPLAMCTKQCFLNSDCGPDAVCTGDGDNQCSTRKGCVPKACTDDPGLEDASICNTDGGMPSDAGQ